MRRVAVFLGLVSMLGVVTGLAVTRPRPAWPPVEVATANASELADEAEAEVDSDAEAGEAEPAAAGDEVLASNDTEVEASTANEPAPMREPLKVVAMDWEVLAPGVLANGGLKPNTEHAFGKAGLPVTFSSVTSTEAIEVRLGRGGSDENGADIALMPLPAFVASYERLRALSPQVFQVVAWSRGRDALVGESTPLDRPPRGELRLQGEAGSSPSLLGLFVLDQAGLPASRVRLIEPGKHPRRHLLHAVERRKSRQIDARDLVISTADATHLVPVVAVAPAGVLERRRADLVEWSRVWLGGVETLALDPPAAARALAGASGAPEAVDLIDALGWMEFTDLQASARAAGLSGRSAVNVDVLFHRTWDLWRDVGLLTTPPPERIPLSATIIADLARQSFAVNPETTSGTKAGSENEEIGDVLLTHVVRGRRLSAEAESALVNEVGFLAGVFSRSTVEVWVPRSPDAGRRVVSHAIDRFGLPEGRVIARTERDRKAKIGATIVVHDPR